MKAVKILSALLVVAGLTQAAVTVGSAGNNTRGVTAANVRIIELTDADTSDAGDTISADAVSIYGPYKVADEYTAAQYKSFSVYAQGGLIASGDSIEISYQLISGTSLADTTATWTVIDTVATGGKALANVDISAKPARSIIFRILNIDSTRVEITDFIRVCFLKSETYNKND